LRVGHADAGQRREAADRRACESALLAPSKGQADERACRDHADHRAARGVPQRPLEVGERRAHLKTRFEAVSELGDHEVVPATDVQPVVGSLANRHTDGQHHPGVARMLDARRRQADDRPQPLPAEECSDANPAQGLRRNPAVHHQERVAHVHLAQHFLDCSPALCGIEEVALQTRKTRAQFLGMSAERLHGRGHDDVERAHVIGHRGPFGQPLTDARFGNPIKVAHLETDAERLVREPPRHHDQVQTDTLEERKACEGLPVRVLRVRGGGHHRRAHPVKRRGLGHREQRLHPRDKLGRHAHRQDVVDRRVKACELRVVHKVIGRLRQRQAAALSQVRIEGHALDLGLEVNDTGLELGGWNDVVKPQRGGELSQRILEGEVGHVPTAISRSPGI
jgi:hypothetical protein